MGKRSFTKNPENCIFGSFTNPKSSCVFDYWSIHHFYFSGFIYIILHHLLNISSIKNALLIMLVVTIGHMIEEYFGNTSRISLEGIVIDNIGPIIDPKIEPSLRTPDNDYIDNSIGDIISGIISNVLIIWYWKSYGKLPYSYLYGFFIIFYMLMKKAKMLYSK